MKQFSSLPKRTQLSILFGFLMSLGAILLVMAILASVRVTHYRTYKNTQYKFIMKFPAHWSIIPRPKEGALVIFLAPKTSPLDIGMPNVSVTLFPLSKEKFFNFDVFTKETMRQIHGLYEDMMIVLESKPVKVGPRRGYRFAYMGNVKGVTNPAYFMHVWFFRENTAYIITYSARKQDYRRHLRAVNAMINSFATY